MAFKLKISNTYFVPVTVQYPGANGKPERNSFDVEFKRMNRTQLQDTYDKLSKGKIRDEDFLEEVIVSWKGLEDEDGNAIAYTAGKLHEISDSLIQFSPSIVRAFFESVETVREKN